MSLSWGRRYLMCPPSFFGVVYEINPWMHREVTVDVDLAMEQWQHLVDVIGAAGAQVDLLESEPGLPDLVFTANAGVVSGDLFVPARFRHAERRGETPFDVAWFVAHGWRVEELPAEVDHEGAGDTLPFGAVFVSGYRWRSDARSHAAVASLTGTPVRSVELTDPRLYHLDLTFCPLDDRRALCAPDAWDDYGTKVVKELVPEPLVLELDEALSFVANSVVIDRTMLMPACPPRVGRQLEAWGFDIEVVALSEFMKAGGGPRCLTLALDVGSRLLDQPEQQ
ncbi:MAG: amidinotransferase [Acidobacteria bacterium]|nr:amidinotransferase [Acidobacteriota bacterium]